MEIIFKPACADLNLGLSTAPVLYASEEFEFEMIPMMSRRFSKEGDVQRAFDIIKNKRFNFFNPISNLKNILVMRYFGPVIWLKPTH